MAQRNMAQRNMAQRNTAQRNTAQRNTAQRNMAQRNWTRRELLKTGTAAISLPTVIPAAALGRDAALPPSETVRVGKTLRWDPVDERFTNCDEANRMHSRSRRKDFELPKVG